MEKNIKLKCLLYKVNLRSDFIMLIGFGSCDFGMQRWMISEFSAFVLQTMIGLHELMHMAFKLL